MGNITAFGIFSKKALDDPSSSTIKNHVSTLVEFYHDGDSPDVEDLDSVYHEYKILCSR